MNSTLLDNLLAFYEEDPNDPFNIYALAIEYSKSSAENAALYFSKLLIEHPEYLPTYYHAGAFFAQQGRLDKAEEIYRKGVELARVQSNAKALRELQGAYNLLLEDLED